MSLASRKMQVSQVVARPRFYFSHLPRFPRTVRHQHHHFAPNQAPNRWRKFFLPIGFTGTLAFGFLWGSSNTWNQFLGLLDSDEPPSLPQQAEEMIAKFKERTSDFPVQILHSWADIVCLYGLPIIDLVEDPLLDRIHLATEKIARKEKRLVETSLSWPPIVIDEEDHIAFSNSIFVAGFDGWHQVSN